ncbi:MAG: 2-oxo acid dehydrogenase subunit E2 [Firmicutes bacterium]|nr:2-oxo acid dehydrogenase subunit E2 [Bacillota bacterium]
MAKKRFGDRKDGALIRDLDSMHFIMPHIFPNRCDNEAYISERIDLEAINKYVAKKNAENPDDFRYTMFHIIVAALIKTITLRPKMNRFIANKNYYQRNYVSAAFTIKKQFADDGAEGLAFLYAKDTDNVETVHEYIKKKVTDSRSNKNGSTEDSMDIMNKLPRFLSRFIIWIITKLDKHGICPKFLIESDPYYSSVILSNIGSIKLKCGYHHLANWGTNSVFCVIGEKKMTAVFDADGNMQMRETVDLGLTIDERLADGYYYSRTIKLLKKLLENPELLELPMSEEVEY